MHMRLSAAASRRFDGSSTLLTETAVILAFAVATTWFATPAICPCTLPGQSPKPVEMESGLLEVSEIVSRMKAYSNWRDISLAGYDSMREYKVEYDGLVHKKAEMIVRVTYSAPETKRFEIVSESGSRILRNRVLRPLIEAEKETSRGATRQKSIISPENYDFRLLSREGSPGQEAFVLQAVPRKETKFLFVGRIWIDARDFAVIRIEASPAVNPSWWIKNTIVKHSYRKVSGFWMYDQNESTSRVRIGGRARLSVRYHYYSLMGTCSDN